MLSKRLVSSGSSSSSSSSSPSVPSLAQATKDRIESYVKYLHDDVFEGHVSEDEIYFRVARRVNQLFPNYPMGEDLELNAMCIQETASLVRFEWTNKSDIIPYVLIKNIFFSLARRSPDLWDGANKRRAMAYIIPTVFAWLSNSKSLVPDVHRLISKDYECVDARFLSSSPLWALVPETKTGFIDGVYETLKTKEYDEASIMKQLTVAQSTGRHSTHGLPIGLKLSKERFLERFTMLSIPILASFGTSLHMPELDDANSVDIRKIEFLGGEPIVRSFPSKRGWLASVNRSTVPEKNLSWTSLRKSWENARREAARLEAYDAEERIVDKRTEKRLSRSFSQDEE